MGLRMLRNSRSALDPEFDIHLDVGDPGDMIEMLETPNINEFRPHSSLGERTPEQFLGSGDWVPRVPI